MQVNWEDEQECFETFLRELAFFYIPVPIGPVEGLGAEEEDLHLQERKQGATLPLPGLPALP
jgi:hypothetical protein